MLNVKGGCIGKPAGLADLPVVVPIFCALAIIPLIVKAQIVSVPDVAAYALGEESTFHIDVFSWWKTACFNALAAFCAVLVVARWRGSAGRQHISPLILLCLSWILIVASVSVYSSYPELNWFGFPTTGSGSLMWISGAIMAFSASILVRTHTQVKLILSGLLFSSSVIFLVIVAEISGVHLFSLPLWKDAILTNQQASLGLAFQIPQKDLLSATLGNPNYVGGFYAMVLPLAFALIMAGKTRGTHAAGMIFAVIAADGIILSGSRSGMLAGTICASAIAVLLRKNMKSRLILLLVSAILVVGSTDFILRQRNESFVGFFMEKTVEKAQREMEKGHEQMGSGRIGIWANAIKMIEDTLLLGKGPGAFAVDYPNSLDQNRVFIDKPHNMYLQIGYAFGLPALAIFATLLILLYMRIWRFRLHSLIHSAQIGLTFAVLAYIIFGFFNDNVPALSPVFWTLLGLTFAQTYRDPSNSVVVQS